MSVRTKSRDLWCSHVSGLIWTVVEDIQLSHLNIHSRAGKSSPCHLCSVFQITERPSFSQALHPFAFPCRAWLQWQTAQLGCQQHHMEMALEGSHCLWKVSLESLFFKIGHLEGMYFVVRAVTAGRQHLVSQHNVCTVPFVWRMGGYPLLIP